MVRWYSVVVPHYKIHITIHGYVGISWVASPLLQEYTKNSVFLHTAAFLTICVSKSGSFPFIIIF